MIMRTIFIFLLAIMAASFTGCGIDEPTGFNGNGFAESTQAGSESDYLDYLYSNMPEISDYFTRSEMVDFGNAVCKTVASGETTRREIVTEVADVIEGTEDPGIIAYGYMTLGAVEELCPGPKD